MARPGFTSHKKFKRLVAILRLPKPYVLGLCEWMWDHAYRDGDPVLGDSIDVEIAAEWPGERGVFTKALIDCGGDGQAGLVEIVDGRHQIHDFWEGAPDYVKSRYRMHRWRKATQKTAADLLRNQLRNSNVTVTPMLRDVTPSPVPVPSCAETLLRQNPNNNSAHSTPTSSAETVKPASNGKFTAADIEAIYQAYPKHVGKRAAINEIGFALKRIKSEHPVEWLMDRVKAFAASPSGIPDKFCPHPSTWFHQDRFHDDPKAWDKKVVRGNGNWEREHGL